MFRGYLAGRSCPQNTRENQLSWLFAFQLCAVHMASLRGKSSRKIPVNTPLIFNVALSLHTLSHTQLIQWNLTQNAGYIRLNKITIKFGIELKPTQNSCKLQLYNLLIWLFYDKTSKTDSKLKREFGNNGKTHSHLD